MTSQHSEIIPPNHTYNIKNAHLIQFATVSLFVANSAITRPCSTASIQYAHGEIHTNTVEGYFSIFKRGVSDVH